MKTFDEFKSERIFTVGELIERLKLLNPDTKIESDGPDCGGCDICTKPYCVIDINTESNTIYLSNNNYDAYTAVEKGRITYEQYQEIVCENNIEN